MTSQKIDIQNELYLDVQNSEIKIAYLRNKKLIEFNKEISNSAFAVGDIYLGKVKRLIPGLNAAFIDIGYKRDAFLHYLDLGAGFQNLNKFLNIAQSYKQKNINIRNLSIEPDIDKNGKITDLFTVGQYVLVQIAKEPILSKGPRLTCEISIAGRNLVLMPFNLGVSVSKKIKSQEERIRLKNLIEKICPKNYGVIVRTIAESKMVAELDKEINNLIDKWETILKILPEAKPPKLMIGEVNMTTAILRDIVNTSFNQIVVNDEDTYNDIKKVLGEMSPENKNIVKLYNGFEPIFDHYGIQRQIKSSFGKIVPMKNGAYLVIEHTEAAHVIDVNSGNKANSEQNQEQNALDVNLLAAEEIARQLRLRDMGGIIIVDFIDIHGEKNKRAIYDTFVENMKGDRAKSHINQLSKFCIMEITRQRVRPEIEVKTAEVCPCCKGSGKIEASIILIDEIENNLVYIIKKYKLKNIMIKAHPFVAAYLNKGFFSSISKKWQKKHQIKLKTVPMMSYSYMEFNFFDSAGEQIVNY